MMEQHKDIRFAEKKVDQEWKEQAASRRDQAAPQKTSSGQPKTAPLFMNLIQSLGLQALIHLGEIPNPMTQQKEVQLEAAKETIDLLIELKGKTLGNLSSEEQEIFESLLTQLQLKFAQHV